MYVVPLKPQLCFGIEIVSVNERFLYVNFQAAMSPFVSSPSVLLTSEYLKHWPADAVIVRFVNDG